MQSLFVFLPDSLIRVSNFAHVFTILTVDPVLMFCNCALCQALAFDFCSLQVVRLSLRQLRSAFVLSLCSVPFHLRNPRRGLPSDTGRSSRF